MNSEILFEIELNAPDYLEEINPDPIFEMDDLEVV